MELSGLEQVERRAASSVRVFLEVVDRPEADEERRDRLKNLCCSLSCFLAMLLRGERSWTRYRGIESIYPWSEIAHSPTELEINGRAVWMPREANAFWVEPFSARLMVDPQESDQVDYLLQFADESIGLGKTPYHAESWGMEEAWPEKWMYEFRKDG